MNTFFIVRNCGFFLFVEKIFSSEFVCTLSELTILGALLFKNYFFVFFCILVNLEQKFIAEFKYIINILKF